MQIVLGGVMKVVIAHEDLLFRSGLQLMLEDGGAEVVATAGNLGDTLRYARGHKPDVLVADGPCSDGLNGGLPDKTNLVLVSSEDVPEAMSAVKDGATGLVMTSEGPQALLDAVKAASDGEPYLNPRMAIAMARHEDDDLTEREIEVLRLIALGYTNAEVGSELYLSIRTAESHRANIMLKIDANSRKDLVAHARERGLI